MLELLNECFMSPGSDLGVVPDTSRGKVGECGEKVLFCVLNLPRGGGVVTGVLTMASQGMLLGQEDSCEAHSLKT